MKNIVMNLELSIKSLGKKMVVKIGEYNTLIKGFLIILITDIL